MRNILAWSVGLVIFVGGVALACWIENLFGIRNPALCMLMGAPAGFLSIVAFGKLSK